MCPVAQRMDWLRSHPPARQLAQLGPDNAETPPTPRSKPTVNVLVMFSAALKSSFHLQSNSEADLDVGLHGK